MDRQSPADTHAFLEQRFARDGTGDYQPHQPVFGIGRGSEAGELLRVARSYRLLRWLDALQPQSVVDLGAAEGYVGNLLRLRHGCPVLCCDLSLEACRRAAEIYALPGVACSVEALPLKTGCADVAILSEVFEHLVNPLDALAECLRVSRRAFVFSTQELCSSAFEQSIRLALREFDVPHAELNFVTRADLRGLFTGGVALAPQFRRSLRRSAQDIAPEQWLAHAAWLADPQGWQGVEGVLAVVSLDSSVIPPLPAEPDHALLELLINGPPPAEPQRELPWDWLEGVGKSQDGSLSIDASGFRRAVDPAGAAGLRPAAVQTYSRRVARRSVSPARRRLLSVVLRTMERLGHLTSSDPWHQKRAWLLGRLFNRRPGKA